MNKNTLKQFNEIHLAFIELSKQINEVLEEQNIDISREQMGVFKLLMENKKMSMKDIAYRQGVYKTAITKRIKKMKDKGFVKKSKFS
ncbi:MarR family winged helix-turn-helix transcriptional regulator [Staphylococcus warneri]